MGGMGEWEEEEEAEEEAEEEMRLINPIRIFK